MTNICASLKSFVCEYITLTGHMISKNDIDIAWKYGINEKAKCVKCNKVMRIYPSGGFFI